MLPKYTFEDRFFVSKSLLFLKKIWFGKLKFVASTFISDIKYNHLILWNNHIFYPFNNKIDYALACYFPEFEIIKGNINKFLANLFMAQFIKKPFY